MCVCACADVCTCWYTNRQKSINKCETGVMKHGAERVSLQPNAMFRVGQPNSHLECYALVDVALDTWPYAGTTTTVEAALMGVPAITCATSPSASVHASNVGRGLNAALGLWDLVASSRRSEAAPAPALVCRTGVCVCEGMVC